MNRAGGFTCRNAPVSVKEGGGRCRLHAGLVADPDGAELERLRLLQEAAERHAFIADQAIGEGENGDQDLAFNRNARTAATLLRTRRALAPAKDRPKGEQDAPGEAVEIEIGGNPRPPAADAAAPDASAPARPKKDEPED